MSNFSLSLVTCIWKRPPDLLARSLSTWVDQSLPPAEIIVSDINPDQGESDKIKAVCDEYDIVTHIHTPIPVFTISRAINIGIKATREDSAYVACTGSEMIFSKEYFEVLVNRMTPNILTQVTCGWLPKEVSMPLHPHDEWKRLINSIVPDSHIQVSGGTILCATREWWFRIQGYDEKILFLWPDSDLARRAVLSEMGLVGIPWEKVQALHQWHEPFSIMATGRTLNSLQIDTTITRNRLGWGLR